MHWCEFLQRLLGRGLSGAQLITSDDHAGLQAARKAVFPGVPWQRCRFHLQQNASQYVVRVEQRKEVAADLRAIFNAPNRAGADRLLAQAVRKYKESAPRLSGWMEDNIEQGLTIFSLPTEQQKRLRTTNLCERELIPMAAALNVGVTAWSPLANGILTGKYHGIGSSEPGRMSGEMMKDFLPEQQRADRVVAAVKTLSDEIGRSMAQVALAWLRYRSVPVIPIIGARKLSQLQDNLASFELALSEDQLKTLDEASRIELGFPHDLYAKELPRTFIYGGMRDHILA